MSHAVTAVESGAPALQRPTRQRYAWLCVTVAVLLAVSLASVTVGSRTVNWAEIVAGVSGNTDTLGAAAVAKRVARTVMAVLVGAALGVSGALMQGVTRNPLADPGILGVNMGASLAVVTGIAWFGLSSYTSFIWAALVGAALAAALVYVIASLGRGGASPLKLAMAGAATAVASSSFLSAVVLPRGDIAGSVLSWQIGGVGGASAEAITHVIPFLFVGLLLSVIAARSLNALALGDELAAGLGERVLVSRATAAVAAIVLAAAATAVAGPIGFVGLVVPHACRLLIGVDHRWLLPLSALVGAILLTSADIVGRIIARPEEIDVGIITALIGAPFFIAIVRRQKIREL